MAALTPRAAGPHGPSEHQCPAPGAAYSHATGERSFRGAAAQHIPPPALRSAVGTCRWETAKKDV